MKEKLPRITHKAYFLNVLTCSYTHGYFSLLLLEPCYLVSVRTPPTCVLSVSDITRNFMCFVIIGYRLMRLKLILLQMFRKPENYVT
jgi:hypothetical protein